jgi:MFS family permease
MRRNQGAPSKDHEMRHGRRAGTRTVVATLGFLQILAWGSTFYLLGVLANPIAIDTGWPKAGVIAGLSVGLLSAGLVSPSVGRMIQRRGGRLVLAAGSILLGAGLGILAVAPSFEMYLTAWVVIGVGMGAGLYDPAFATLGRLYGHGARRSITAVTLFSGFASTISWPITALFLVHDGWRRTCGIYAAAHIVVGAPAYFWLLPTARLNEEKEAPATGPGEPPLREQPAGVLILLGAIFTIAAAILSLVSTHLLALLQVSGLSLAAAVALGALVGPAQVAARVVELAFARNSDPRRTMLVGTASVAIGLVLLWLGRPLTAVALIAYGAGNGIGSVVRGTVPLALYGAARYPVLMGRLGLPILLAMALAPTIGAALVGKGGAALPFAVLSFLALLNVGLSLIPLRWTWSASKDARENPGWT